MKHFILLFAIVTLSTSEIYSTEGPSQIIGVPGPRWQGPFANHILGQPVGDTPEVAAAKAAHYLAHEKILEIVPELPPQERYNTVNVGQPQQVYAPQQVNYVPQQQQVSYVPQQQQVNYVPQHHQVVYVPQQQQVTYVPQQPYVVQQAKVPEVHINVPSVVQQQVQNVPKFSQFTEDTPEVAAARKAHLAAFEEIKKLLPQLEETTTQAVEVNYVPQQQQVTYVPQQPAYAAQEANVPKAHINVPSAVVAPVVQQQVQVVPKFTQFAEDIPRSELGEVPEVAAARKAHLAAFEKIRKLLPELEETTTQAVEVNYVPQQQQVTYVPQHTAYAAQEANVPKAHINVPSAVVAPVVQQQVQVVPKFTQFAEDIPRSELGEVPEVAAARKAHLAAYEKIRKLLPELEETTTQTVEITTPQVDDQHSKIVTPDFQLVNQQPQVFTQQNQVVAQVPQVVYQQPQVKSEQTQTVNQQDDSLLWRQQLQRNLDWFYNPQQFYSYLPQDTPEVAAAKIEHLKLLQALN